MRELCWWLVDVLSHALQPGERDAVRGDFAESGETGAQALRGLLGLVVQRQAEVWRDWPPWLALIGLIAPLAMLLSIVSTSVANQSATYAWLYAHNWDWALLRYVEFWYELRDSVTLVFARCLPLVCWSWTAGFVIGSVSRRSVHIYGVPSCLMLVFGLLGAPRYLAYLVEQARRPLPPGDHILTLELYREILPWIVQVMLVAAPFLWGMQQGTNARGFRPGIRVALWTAAIGTLALLTVQEPGFGVLREANWLQRIWQTWPMHLLQLIAYWPVGYLAAREISSRWHDRAASTV
jgi:hypothetical protein